jgi:hypothetical protein
MKLDELEARWNANADKSNQWSELGLDEIVAFAQHECLVEAAERFEGALSFNWVCADDYPNGPEIGGELRYMAYEISAANELRS